MSVRITRSAFENIPGKYYESFPCTTLSSLAIRMTNKQVMRDIKTCFSVMNQDFEVLYTVQYAISQIKRFVLIDEYQISSWHIIHHCAVKGSVHLCVHPVIEFGEH